MNSETGGLMPDWPAGQADPGHAHLENGIDTTARQRLIVDPFSGRATIHGDDIQRATIADEQEHVIAKRRLDVGPDHRALELGLGRVDL